LECQLKKIPFINVSEVFKQAKKIEKEQIINAYNESKINSLLEAAKPLIKYLNNNYHPHCKIIVECDSVEVVEGVEVSVTREFIKD
jgi:hypothetical protein